MVTRMLLSPEKAVRALGLDVTKVKEVRLTINASGVFLQVDYLVHENDLDGLKAGINSPAASESESS